MQAGLRRSLRRAVKHGANRVLNLGLDALGPPRLEKLGSDYGGWWVPVGLMDASWVVYSGGAGDDITFDLEVARRFGAEVHAFDPTELAARHVEEAARGEPRFHFHPYGLWTEDGEVRFFEPKDPHMVSANIVNLDGTGESTVLPVRRLASVMRELGHHHVHLLKLDIEGAEYAVIASALEDGIEPEVICVELERPRPLSAGLAALEGLWDRYRLVRVDGKNFTFVKKGFA